MPGAVEVVGPYRGATGYDRHTREFVRHFVRLGARVQLHPLDGWSRPLPESSREPWFEQLNVPVGAGVLLHFAMPTDARPRAGIRNVNYTMFEADRIPRVWAERAADHDRIVVPTESSRQAWMESGVPAERLRVSPLGVDAAFFAAPSPPLPVTVPDGRDVSSFRHRFLNVAALWPRKNHLGLLRCWIRATRPEDDGVLLLKTDAESPAVLDKLRADVETMQRKLGRTLAGAAPVVFLPVTFTNEQLRALYRTATHYISLSKGEGWDLVMMEAIAAGLQAIAPRHSAYTSYLGEGDAEWVESKLAPARFEGSLCSEDWAWFKGVQWWDPDEDAATDLIRRILDGRTSPKTSPRERIARDYSWNVAAQSLLELLDEAVNTV